MRRNSAQCDQMHKNVTKCEKCDVMRYNAKNVKIMRADSYMYGYEWSTLRTQTSFCDAVFYCLRSCLYYFVYGGIHKLVLVLKIALPNISFTEEVLDSNNRIVPELV